MTEKLAIEGGRPVRPANLPYGHQWVSAEDIEAVAENLRGDWLTQGPLVDRFELELAKFAGARHAVVFANGTAALHGAAFVAGAAPGVEAVTSTVSFLASANCAAYCGAVPRLADIDPRTHLVTAESLSRSTGPNTRLLIPVHLGGAPCEMEAIGRLAEELGAKVIEDACHALGATYRGRPVGDCSYSDMAVLSFHPVKHITTAEGGAVLTNDDELAHRLKVFRCHGMERESDRFEASSAGPWYYEMQTLGYNYRLPDMNCALGLSQMKRLPEFLARRRELAAMYRERLKDTEHLMLPPPDDRAAGTESAYHVFIVSIDMAAMEVGKARLFDAMRAENIGVQVHYLPIHLQPYYRRTYGFRRGDFPEAERYYESCMTLPTFPAMSNQDVEDVVRALTKVLCRYRRAAPAPKKHQKRN